MQDKPMFKKMFSYKVPSNFLKNHNNRGSNPKPMKGRNVDRAKERQTCGKCGNKHVVENLLVTSIFYGCGKGGHMVKDYLNVRSQGKGNSQTQSSVSSFEDSKRNRLYSLKVKGEKEYSPDVMTGMLNVFSVNVYAFLDLGAILLLLHLW